MIKDNLVKEMQVLHSKIKENKFICLKEYPNKYLLSKSKIINFKNNNQFFDQRCMLFIEYTFLLLKIEVDSGVVYITKNIFINHFGEIYYFYTFDSTHQNKMVKIVHGNLIQNIISAFNHIFLKQAQQIKDFQYHSIYVKTVNSLIGYLQELKQKSDKYYYQIEGEAKYNYQFKQEPSNPYPVLAHLQNSDIFKEYNYATKYNTAILIRGIIDNNPKNDIKTNYILLSHQYYLLIREIDGVQNALSINKSVGVFYLNLYYFLKILQKSLYLKVTVSQNDFNSTFEIVKQHQVACEISLQSNIKNQVRINQTTQEQLSESSINDKQLTKQQRDKYNRYKQYMESLFIFKNRINFNLKIKYRIPQRHFQIQIEALSLWTIEQIYFVHVRDLWARLINSWFNAYTNEDVIDYKVGDFKFDMFHKNKNVGIKTVIRINKKQNLLEEFIIVYDRMLIILLLLQHSFKKIFKLGFHIYEFNKRSLQEMSQAVFLQNKIARLKLAFVKYTQYYKELIKLTEK